MSDFGPITAVVLAGGRARRMGGRDKGLLPVAGRPMIAWTLDRLAGQAGRVLINANRSQDEYRRFGPEVIGDRLGDFQGPLAGLQSALDQADGEWLLALPCDAPLLPRDLAARLLAAARESGQPIAVAEAGGRLHSLHVLLATRLAPALDRALVDGERKPDRFYADQGFVRVAFDDQAEAFANINTPDELAALEHRLNQEFP
ncbi:MAG: molybdenum cofactor guanylyltransferase MobA [Wenzhouxiangellaceae bacterium]|nr:molybdenum cofactor guanylyltransferase MobA [Wenzhouxiangellaceae bacterium]